MTTSPGHRPAAAPPVSIRELDYTYPDGTTALRQASLGLDRGERVALLGGNGAGKTTLALHLNGLLTPPPGRVEITGLDPADTANLDPIRRRLQLVFANPDDQLFMPTVGEDVAFGPRNLGRDEDETTTAVYRALDSVDARHLIDRPPHRLSTGEKRRAALATSLAMEPEILVLDEPSAGLDPRGRRRLIDLLQSLPQTLLVITHDLSLASALCPRSVIMRCGRIVADLPTGELMSDVELLWHYDLEPPPSVPSRTGTDYEPPSPDDRPGLAPPGE